MEFSSQPPRLDFLLVDDDEIFRARVERALKQREFAVDACGSVDEAIARLKIKAPARVLLDLKMPGRNGLELMEHIAKEYPTIEVVVLTGYGTIATATAAIKLGAINYLSKPVNVEQILDAFEDLPQARGEIPVPSLSQVEWEHIHRVITDCQGNISQAAKLLGMHRRSLQRKLQKSPI